jgi:hypothetical protein
VGERLRIPLIGAVIERIGADQRRIASPYDGSFAAPPGADALSRLV